MDLLLDVLETAVGNFELLNLNGDPSTKFEDYIFVDDEDNIFFSGYLDLNAGIRIFRIDTKTGEYSDFPIDAKV